MMRIKHRIEQLQKIKKFYEKIKKNQKRAKLNDFDSKFLSVERKSGLNTNEINKGIIFDTFLPD